MWAALRWIPLSASVSRGAIAPTIVTSRPSSTHTVPRPITIRQWKRDQGSRSSRAGTAVLITRPSAVALMVPGTRVGDGALPPAGSPVWLFGRRGHDALGVPARLRGGWLQALPVGEGGAALRPGLRPRGPKRPGPTRAAGGLVAAASSSCDPRATTPTRTGSLGAPPSRPVG